MSKKWESQDAYVTKLERTVRNKNIIDKMRNIYWRRYTMILMVMHRQQTAVETQPKWKYNSCKWI